VVVRKADPDKPVITIVEPKADQPIVATPVDVVAEVSVPRGEVESVTIMGVAGQRDEANSWRWSRSVRAWDGGNVVTVTARSRAGVETTAQATFTFAAASGPKPTIAVLAVESTRGSGDEAFRRSFRTAMTGKLVAALVQRSRFEVVDADKVAKLLAQQGTSSKKAMSCDEAARLGRLLHADYVVWGGVTKLAISKTSKENPYAAGNYVLTIAGSAALDPILVDARTGGGLLTSAVAVEQTVTRSEKSEPDLKPTAGETETLEDALASALDQAVFDAIVPIKVISLAGGVLFLNRGEGLSAGDLLDVFEVVGGLIDPDTGTPRPRPRRRSGASASTPSRRSTRRRRPSRGAGSPWG
jgi:curli biogenesis system outer membrane secretion channel CsgG